MSEELRSLLLDSGGPRRIWPRLKELGVGVWDPDKVVLASDHFTPAVDAESAAILKLTRDFAAKFGIERVNQGSVDLIWAYQLIPGLPELKAPVGKDERDARPQLIKL